MTTASITPPSELSDNYHWKVFWTVAIALFAMVLDFSIVFLALSSIADEFEVTLRAVTWVAIASSLVMSATMLPLGRVSDITGRKKFHITGMILFVIGALIAFSAQNLEMLIAARVVMALGSAMGQAVVFAIIVGVFPSEQRGKALGMITTIVAIGAAAGPIVAGPVIQEFDWRAIFLVIAVPTIAGIVAASIVLDDLRIGSTAQRVSTKYDWLGAILSAGALSLTILTISNPFAFDWISIEIIGGAVLSVALFASLVWWELRISYPMLNLRFFQNSTFSWSTSTRFLGFLGGSATFFLMPIFIQSFMGYDQRLAGMVIFVGAVGMGLASQFSGRFSDKYGFRPFTFAGISTMIVTNVIFSFFVADTSLWVVSPVLFLNGLGMGMWMAPNMSATLSTVGRGDYGSMSAFLNLIRNVGGVIGQALAAAIIAGIMLSRGVEVQLNELTESTDPAVSEAFLAGWTLTFLVLTGFLVLALFAAFKTKVYTADSTD
ncbi:MAG: MFS transporter [Dehalococcoidia bacterium]|nr:MFS transporter [Dehalococcoidia bacterium]MDP7262639.1 MFS transporter [Dehalococcoidia bacterium]